VSEPTTLTKTVLLVEDEEAAQHIFTTTLTYAGYHALVAPDAATGLRLLDEVRPDLIIMDIGLPGAMDGFELTARLRQDPRTRDVPIMVVTVYAFDHDAQRARDAGCTAFITKPVEPTKVLAEVERLIGPA
jgi:two-component system, cell cycle response regulator DivK